MTDTRLLHSNGRVAHVSLKDEIQADSHVEGELSQIVQPVASLLDNPNGLRQRELVFGELFNRLQDEDGYSFGYALRDGYAGYIDSEYLNPVNLPATHVVGARMTYACAEPDIKSDSGRLLLSMGARVAVVAEREKWAEIDHVKGSLFVPASHLRRIDEIENDPVEVAERLLGTPYVWGGNSALGIDCSGLVQMACLACGIDCPGDSDLQMAGPGIVLSADVPLKRGDLLFWKGHVAWVLDADAIIHANAFHMAVSHEPTHQAIERIEAYGDGKIIMRKRL
ncbi:MAG: NlpC/P60 family protein [Roseovarius sp.]|nr:NlpC/P60 family protein [Roseovarius sp.]MCY4314993.1 NlpC/P60 family protein [Roseovarius sp.]